MFENALLDSSPRRASVLRRIHYLFSAFAGVLLFALGLHLIPILLAPLGERALLIAAVTVGTLAALYALMLCYVAADTRQQHLRTWPWVGLTLFLNLPGFLIYLVYSAWKTGDWKRAAIPLAYVAESLIVGVLILVPLIYTQALPRQLLITDIHIPPPPGPPPAPAPGRPTPPQHHPAVDPLITPVKIPVGIVPVVEPPEPLQVAAGPAGQLVPGVPPGFGGGNGVTPGGSPWPTEAPPPPPPVAHPATNPSMIRVSRGVIEAQGVYQPKPVYPQLAVMTHTQGTVVLQAIIGKDGAIEDLKVLSGHPLLVRAAMDAVKTWRYQPTLLNSEPVDVLTEIEVRFNLSE
jgi:protein TonB